MPPSLKSLVEYETPSLVANSKSKAAAGKDGKAGAKKVIAAVLLCCCEADTLTGMAVNEQHLHLSFRVPCHQLSSVLASQQQRTSSIPSCHPGTMPVPPC